MAKQNRRAGTTLAAALVAAIRDSGHSAYAVAKESGVAYPVLHRFLAGERGLTLDTADKLCRFLGLRLVKAKTT